MVLHEIAGELFEAFDQHSVGFSADQELVAHVGWNSADVILQSRTLSFNRSA